MLSSSEKFTLPLPSGKQPTPATAEDLGTDIDIDCIVEAVRLPEDLKYGVVRWLGIHNNKPIVGLEMVGSDVSIAFASKWVFMSAL